jgi:hypothetical protein
LIERFEARLTQSRERTLERVAAADGGVDRHATRHEAAGNDLSSQHPDAAMKAERVPCAAPRLRQPEVL